MRVVSLLVSNRISLGSGHTWRGFAGSMLLPGLDFDCLFDLVEGNGATWIPFFLKMSFMAPALMMATLSLEPVGCSGGSIEIPVAITGEAGWGVECKRQ